jgi:hypothetical protein
MTECSCFFEYYFGIFIGALIICLFWFLKGKFPIGMEAGR